MFDAARGAGRVIDRPRVIQLLRARFDHRVTVLEAPAGAGKTTSLGLAIEANHVEPFGLDVFYALSRHDGEPDHLLGGIAAALDVAVHGGVESCVAALADSVWARAPRDLVLVLDDTHLIDGSSSVPVVGALLDALPHNGHLLLSGRTRLAVPLARLRAHGQLLELTGEELGLDDEELAALIQLRWAPEQSALPAGSLPRLAAVADLRLRAGPGADAEFLWEEVLNSLDERRRAVLQRSCVLAVLDDHLVAALSGSTMTASQLVNGLPLVDAAENGTFRLHSILRAALAERLSREELSATGRMLAEVEFARGNLRAAIELWIDAGDSPSALDAARRFALLPVMRRSFGDLLVVRSLVDHIAPGSALGELLRVESHFGELSTTTDVASLGAQLRLVAERAREDGDGELEAMALFRAWEWISLEQVVPDDLVHRLAELSLSVAIARQTVRFVRAEAAMFRGDPDEAMSLLGPNHLAGADADVEAILRAGVLCSLGRPELVGAGLTTADLAGMPEGAELYVGFALWNRGQLSPEHALGVAMAMTTEVLSRRVVHPIVAILGVTTFMALATGDTAIAERHVRRARDEARYGCAAHLLAFTAMAEAATTLTLESEEAAAAQLETMLAAIPIGGWPIRAYLLGLPIIYALCPSARTSLDRCRFGPALTTACDAARALVLLRERGSLEGAAALPWHQESCLRAHVLPVHLCELAIAAELVGNAAAAEVVDRLPRREANLRRVAAVSSPVVARAAAGRLAVVEAGIDADVRVIALGPIGLVIDGNTVEHADWETRSRVRELFAVTVSERKLSRSRVAGLLWPDLDQAKALRNVRVTLFYLHRVLVESGLGTPEHPAIRANGDRLETDFSYSSDVEEFDELIRRAVEQDRAGAPAAAVDLYRQALTLYHGEYLADIQSDWVAPERTRLQLLATSAMLRVGELELAAGEPERAVRWATRANEVFPHNERAVRLVAACHVSVGARSQAAAVLREVVSGLRAEGVQPEPETLRALGRLSTDRTDH